MIELPGDLECDLRAQMGTLDAEAREAFAVDLDWQRKLTHAQLSRILGLSRFEADAVLKRYQVFYDLTAKDVACEAEQLRQLRSTE